MTNASFNLLAEQVLDVMCELAEQKDVKGVAFIASLEDDKSDDWQCRMKVCGSAVKFFGESEGINLAAVAFSKIAEMMETKKASGNASRNALKGETLEPGGAISQDDFGYIAASFAGGSPEDDYSISISAVKFFKAII